MTEKILEWGLAIPISNSRATFSGPAAIKSRRCGHPLPPQGVGQGLGDDHVHERADELVVVGAKVDHPVVLGAALELARVLLRDAGDQQALGAAHHAPADFQGVLLDTALENPQAFLLHRLRRVVRQVGGGGAGAGAVYKAEGGVEADLLDELHGGGEIRLALPREAHDKVGRNADIRANLPKFADFRRVFKSRVAALHGRQDPVRAALHRQVEVAYQLRHPGVGLDQGIGELHRVGGGVADALYAVDAGHVGQQLGEYADAPVRHLTPEGVYILAQQVDLLDPLARQVGDLVEHICHRADHFLTPGVGHHAEGAVLGTALHDGHEGRHPIGFRLGQAVELLDLGKADVHDGDPVAPAVLADHLRQAVQGLGAEHQVHVGRPAGDGVPLLAGDAAADADHQVGVPVLQGLPAAQLVEDLFLGLFAD